MSGATFWHDFYYSDLQSPLALLVAPFAFLVYRTVRGRPKACEAIGPAGEMSRFVWAYTAVWAVQTMLDPLCTGPLSRALGIDQGFAGTALMFAFVLLGDLRVFVLVFGVAALATGSRSWLGRAGAWTLIVPLFAGAIYGGLGLVVDELHGQTLWLAYELGFVAMAVALGHSWIPTNVPAHAAVGGVEVRAALRACVAYVAAYYAMWAAADVLVLVGLDEAWALRIVPNQLYYAFWVPFVYARFFAPDRASS